MEDRDPIKLLAEDSLKASGEVNDSAFERDAQGDQAKSVDEDYLRAEREVDPEPQDVEANLWGSNPVAEKPPIQAGRQTMVSAIGTTFRGGFGAAIQKYVFFGEDIEDAKGGVFGLTKGLSLAFPKQVFNSPLAEATIMGVAVGMAAYGYHPVFELQFIDFIAPGWNQITTNMATLRWRSNGHWECPCVIYAPYGAYLPGGSLWHSQSNEAYLAHTPGLKLAIPLTPRGCGRPVLDGHAFGDDRCFILVPKHIFRKQIEVESALSQCHSARRASSKKARTSRS